MCSNKGIADVSPMLSNYACPDNLQTAKCVKLFGVRNQYRSQSACHIRIGDENGRLLSVRWYNWVSLPRTWYFFSLAQHPNYCAEYEESNAFYCKFIVERCVFFCRKIIRENIKVKRLGQVLTRSIFNQCSILCCVVMANIV